MLGFRFIITNHSLSQILLSCPENLGAILEYWYIKRGQLPKNEDVRASKRMFPIIAFDCSHAELWSRITEDSRLMYAGNTVWFFSLEIDHITIRDIGLEQACNEGYYGEF